MRACCEVGNAKAPTWVRHCVEVGAWAFPTAVLALVPKCPACLAAWFAVATGLGISLAAAAYLRIGLIVICVGLLAYLGIRRAVRHLMPTARFQRGQAPDTGAFPRQIHLRDRSQSPP
jgi:hypothetical protein